MDLKQILNTNTSTENAKKIELWIGTDPDRMHQLMDLFFNGSFRENQLAAHPLMYISDNNPGLFKPFIELMVENLTDDKHDAVIRNTLRVFQNIDLPENVEGEVFDKCMNYLSNPRYPVGIRVFAMTVLTNICIKYPELKAEVQPLIEDILEISESGGMISRGRKMLAILNSLSEL